MTLVSRRGNIGVRTWRAGEVVGPPHFRVRWRQKTSLGGLAHLSEKQVGTPGEHQSQKSSQESFTKEVKEPLIWIFFSASERQVALDTFSKEIVTKIALLHVTCYDTFSRGKKILRQTTFKVSHIWDFPGGPVVKILCFHGREHSVDPWSGNQDHTCHVVWPKKRKENVKWVTYQVQSIVRRLSQLWLRPSSLGGYLISVDHKDGYVPLQDEILKLCFALKVLK